jgi:hypothetical protein
MNHRREDCRLGLMRRVMNATGVVAVLAAAAFLAGCGSGSKAAPPPDGPSHRGRTVTFVSGGNFPPTTIVGRYSLAGCRDDARKLVHDARLYYAHSTGLPGPADLYYYDMRFSYAHFQADGCTSRELGEAMKAGLTTRQRTFLLHNVARNLYRAFRAALSSV